MNDFFDREFKSIITGALGALFVTLSFADFKQPSTDDPFFIYRVSRHHFRLPICVIILSR